MTIWLKITLHDDVIVSASSATANQHESLDYLAGRLLLGVAATQLYSQLTPFEAWQLFHSGEVKFGNGYSINAAGEPGWPVPQSLYYNKNDSHWQDASGQLNPAALARGGVDEFNGQQPKQLRGGYLSVSGRRHEVAKRRTMKSAIDADTGRASEGQLFGYEALAAGQQFVCPLRLPVHLDAALETRLVEALVGAHRLGGSRSAQYGRVVIEQLEAPVQLPASMAVPGQTELTLWCVSELALVCPHTGQPVLQPRPELFGLSGGVLCNGKSAIRHRSFSAFNGYRRSFDREQQVVSPGSIIHFENLNPPLTAAQIEGLAQGAGAYQEIGFGQLIAEPALLCQSALTFAAPAPLEAADCASATVSKPANSPLIEWLEAQQASLPADYTHWVTQVRTAMDACFIQARRIGGIDPALEIGPSPSQWGSVASTARNLRNQPEALMAQLFDATDALCKRRAGSDYSWELIVGFDAQHNEQPLSSWLKQQCSGQSPEAIARLAAEMRTTGRHREQPRQGGKA